MKVRHYLLLPFLFPDVRGWKVREERGRRREIGRGRWEEGEKSKKRQGQIGRRESVQMKD
jgi:hypothetical protein